jgi:hypothetical protein
MENGFLLIWIETQTRKKSSCGQVSGSSVLWLEAGCVERWVREAGYLGGTNKWVKLDEGDARESVEMELQDGQVLLRLKWELKIEVDVVGSEHLR